MEITVDVMENLKKIKKVLVAPKTFFKNTVKEKGWRLAFAYLIVVAAIGHVLLLIFNLAFPPNLTPEIKEMLGSADISYSPNQIVLATLIGFIATLGMSFIWAGALKLWLSLFKVESTYNKSYKIIAYSRTPNLLFSWLPYVNIAAGLYSFYLIIIALEKEHGLKRGKSLLIVVLAVVLLLVLSAIFLTFLPSV